MEMIGRILKRFSFAGAKFFALALVLIWPLGLSSAEKHELLIFRDPSLSRTQIAFSYAGKYLGSEPRRRRGAALDDRRA